MAAEPIDLTGDTPPTEEAQCSSTPFSSIQHIRRHEQPAEFMNSPIGVDICPDLMDLTEVGDCSIAEDKFDHHIDFHYRSLKYRDQASYPKHHEVDRTKRPKLVHKVKDRQQRSFVRTAATTSGNLNQKSKQGLSKPLLPPLVKHSKSAPQPGQLKETTRKRGPHGQGPHGQGPYGPPGPPDTRKNRNQRKKARRARLRKAREERGEEPTRADCNDPHSRRTHPSTGGARLYPNKVWRRKRPREEVAIAEGGKGCDVGDNDERCEQKAKTESWKRRHGNKPGNKRKRAKKHLTGKSDNKQRTDDNRKSPAKQTLRKSDNKRKEKSINTSEASVELVSKNQTIATILHRNEDVEHLVEPVVHTFDKQEIPSNEATKNQSNRSSPMKERLSPPESRQRRSDPGKDTRAANLESSPPVIDLSTDDPDTTTSEADVIRTSPVQTDLKTETVASDEKKSVPASSYVPTDPHPDTNTNKADAIRTSPVQTDLKAETIASDEKKSVPASISVPIERSELKSSDKFLTPLEKSCSTTEPSAYQEYPNLPKPDTVEVKHKDIEAPSDAACHQGDTRATPSNLVSVNEDGQVWSCSSSDGESEHDTSEESEEDTKSQIKQAPASPKKTFKIDAKYYEDYRCEPERRYVVHALPRKKPTCRSSLRTVTDRVFNYQFTSKEQAEREQERLLRQAASRLRQNTHFKVASDQVNRPKMPEMSFTTRVPNVNSRYPHHWKFKDSYARLGLPSESSRALVKQQYRKLALVYHPDKSNSEQTIQKFQAVTEAYRDILEATNYN